MREKKQKLKAKWENAKDKCVLKRKTRVVASKLKENKNLFGKKGRTLLIGHMPC